MTIEQFVDKIRLAGFSVVQRAGEYRAQCPAHGGEGLNLAIGRGERGGVVCTCHSHGCSAREVAEAVGATLADLMPPQPANGARPDQLGIVTHRYRYEWANGDLCGETWRYDPKDFRPHYLDSTGHWKMGLGPERNWPLYRLPLLMAADPKEPVLICAGEKDCINLGRLGFVTTTNQGGESVQWKRRTDWTEPLTGRYCVILEHFDPVNPKTGRRPGEEHAKEVFAALTEAGIRCKRLLLPGLEEGEDPSDWIRKGGTADQLRLFVAPEVRFRLLTIQEMLALPAPTWQLKSFWEVGGIVMVFGEGGSGKTFLVVDATMHMVCDLPWHGRAVQGGPVIYVNADGGIPFRQRPQAWLHAFPDSAQKHPFLIYNDRIDMRERGMFQGFIDEQQQRAQKPAIIVLDTFHRVMPGGDENDARDTSQFFDALQAARRDLGCTGLFLHHSNRADTGHRGHSSLRDDSDTAIEVRLEESGLRRVRCDKQRNAAEFPEFFFELRPILDSCVIEMTEAPPEEERSQEPRRRRGEVPGDELRMADLLALIREMGEVTQGRLAELMGLSVSRVSRLCSTLRQRGLIDARQGMAEGFGRRPMIYFPRSVDR